MLTNEELDQIEQAFDFADEDAVGQSHAITLLKEYRALKKHHIALAKAFKSIHDLYKGVEDLIKTLPWNAHIASLALIDEPPAHTVRHYDQAVPANGIAIERISVGQPIRYAGITNTDNASIIMYALHDPTLNDPRNPGLGIALSDIDARETVLFTGPNKNAEMVIKQRSY